MNTNLRFVLSWAITLLVPVALSLASVRAVLNPWYLELEYRTPGFPAEPYGFTFDERLRYARIAVDYLVNDEGVEFLARQRFPEGEQVPPFSCQYMDDCNLMYNQRELAHMVDVKNVVQATLWVWLGTLVVLMGLGVWAWRGGWETAFRLGLRRGAWLTVFLILTILFLVVAAFGVIFVQFHEIFFDPNTWTFYTSDTLIRLFPERFWRDTFFIVGGLTLLMGLGLALLLRRADRHQV